jgi:hypothetical protein
MVASAKAAVFNLYSANYQKRHNATTIKAGEKVGT